MDLRGFMQTRFFYGQRLDVRHFESEQNYVKGKLWLLNRLVHGFGVVCGLDVQMADDHQSVVVQPGIALDKAGREIVVPSPTGKYLVPPLDPAPSTPSPSASKTAAVAQGDKCCDDDYVHICICFHACESDPEPVLAGGCDTMQRCAAGAIRERYKIVVQPGKAAPIGVDCLIPNLLIGNRLNYAAMAEWVTEPCPCPPDDTCISLANVKRPAAGGSLEATDVDITIRPIVYGNDLLFQIILALTGDPQTRRTGK
jgi:hypothetical protein